jgi:hypothetical protein
MFAKRTLLATLTVILIILVIVIFFAWTAWNEGHLGWPHILGLGVTFFLLALIWFWPENDQPTQPPP